jgi:hypothetical protein
MSRIRYLDIDELNDRLEELESLEGDFDMAKEAYDECPSGDSEEVDRLSDALDAARDAFGEPERKELADLRSLKDDIGERGGKISDEGGPFIHENDFEDYARELAEDIGAIDPNAGWPLGCIDWEQAAKELLMDYSSIEWGGETYYYRA